MIFDKLKEVFTFSLILWLLYLL